MQQTWEHEQMQNILRGSAAKNVQPSDILPFIATYNQRQYSCNNQSVPAANKFQHRIPQCPAINNGQQGQISEQVLPIGHCSQQGPLPFGSRPLVDQQQMTNNPMNQRMPLMQQSVIVQQQLPTMQNLVHDQKKMINNPMYQRIYPMEMAVYDQQQAAAMQNIYRGQQKMVIGHENQKIAQSQEQSVLEQHQAAKRTMVNRALLGERRSIIEIQQTAKQPRNEQINPMQHVNVAPYQMINRDQRMPQSQQQSVLDQQPLDPEYIEARQRTLKAMRKLMITHFLRLQNSPESIEAEMFRVSPSMSDYHGLSELFICNLTRELKRRLKERGRRPKVDLAADETTDNEPPPAKRPKKGKNEEVVPDDLREWRQYHYIESIIPTIERFLGMANEGKIKDLDKDLVARSYEIVEKFKERSPIDALELNQVRRFVWIELVPLMAKHRVPYGGPKDNLTPAQVDYVTMLHITNRTKDEKNEEEKQSIEIAEPKAKKRPFDFNWHKTRWH
ncbi:hypothetical protein ACOME3_010774 [Neoechinorhynchus agilis]